MLAYILGSVAILTAGLWLVEWRRRRWAESRIVWCHRLLVYQRERLADAVEEAEQVPARLRLYLEPPAREVLVSEGALAQGQTGGFTGGNATRS